MQAGVGAPPRWQSSRAPSVAAPSAIRTSRGSVRLITIHSPNPMMPAASQIPAKGQPP